MRCACWITKGTDTHSESVILTAFARYQQLCERASMLPYTYTACLGYVLFCVSLWFFVVQSEHFPFDCHQPSTQAERQQLTACHLKAENTKINLSLTWLARIASKKQKIKKKSYGWFKVNKLTIKCHSLKAHRRRWTKFPRILKSGSPCNRPLRPRGWVQPYLFMTSALRRGWAVSTTPRPPYPRGKTRYPNVQEAGHAPGPVWTGAKNLAPHRDSIPGPSSP